MVAATFVLALVASVAWAAWLANGEGAGYTRAATAMALSTSPAETTASLHPGATGDLAVTIVNPNPYPVTVTEVTGNGQIMSDTAGCDATNHGVTFTDQASLDLQVPAQGQSTHVLAGAVHMADTATDACQGAAFSVPIALSGASGWDGDGGGTGGAGGGP